MASTIDTGPHTCVPRWLGGPSAFGLSLPDAAPTPSTMYAPRGVWVSRDLLVVSDTGNHRVLLWHGGVPDRDHADADVVLGQPDMVSEGPKRFFLPTGVAVLDGRLVVADAWHHRLLVWDGVPTTNDEEPAMVLGQPDGIDGVDEGCGPQRFYWPFGFALVDGVFWVADTGNRRVLGWVDGVPTPGRGADVVLGQPDLVSRGENRDGPVAADSVRWPHAVASVGGTLFVADAGNHRVLGWHLPVGVDRPADIVIGQPGFDSAVEFPYRPQGPQRFRFPYGVSSAPDGRLFVADTSNNRVLVVTDASDTFAVTPVGGAVDSVLGQPDLDANGENRWDRVVADSFCWPYGLHWGDGFLAVADSGNNRVVVWEQP
ncbi:MAG: NHL repeat-containing protein [Ilumatobacteraceae bacterium]